MFHDLINIILLIIFLSNFQNFNDVKVDSNYTVMNEVDEILLKSFQLMVFFLYKD